MNMFNKSYLRIFARFVATTPTTNASTRFLAEPLTNRSLVRIQGNDVVPFLQGLITNDMNHLTRGSKSIYAMFLNKAGRVLYDSIIYRTPDETTFLIECDKTVSNELRRHLRLYRVRRKIEIDCIASEFSPWVLFDPKGDEIATDLFSNDIIVCRDPRLKELGTRIILPKSADLSSIKGLLSSEQIDQPTAQNDYTLHRYTLGIGEGVVDHPPTKCFPLEANCDFLHGVSFLKGCYIGQELTARVHHTGVIRKRLMPIALTKSIENDVTDVQSLAGSVVGTLRGFRRNRALALLRVEKVTKSPEIMIDGETGKTYTPDWWPKELPNKASLRE